MALATSWPRTLKSDHEYKDDFRSPGKVYAAVLPADLSGLDEEHPLKMKVIKDGMTRNHGYCRCSKDGRDGSVISCEEGVFWFEAPDAPRGEWKIEQLSDEAASDAMLIDLDGDGEEELFTMLPFHGDTIRILKNAGMPMLPCMNIRRNWSSFMPFPAAISAGSLR